MNYFNLMVQVLEKSGSAERPAFPNEIHESGHQMHVMNERLLHCTQSVDKIGAMVARMEQKWDKNLDACKRGFQMVAGGFNLAASGAASSLPPPPHEDNSPGPVAVLKAPLARADAPNACPGHGHKFDTQVVSISDLYNQWFGLENFENIPVSGGIAALEKNGKGWRKSFENRERKAFSRAKIVIDCIQNEVGKGKGLHTTLAEFNDIFSHDARGFLSKMPDELKKRNLYEPKQRKRRAASPPPPHEEATTPV